MEKKSPIKAFLDEMDKAENKVAENIDLIVKLTLAKLEIIKLKYTDQGYDWHMLGEEGKKQMEATLIKIEELLKQLD